MLGTTQYGAELNNGHYIFVFGSNKAGIHGAGAALCARKYWGADWRVGEGRTGQSYAIPTKDRHLVTRKLPEIEASVQTFLTYADQHPELDFLVTRIGCGLAGYTDREIKPFFSNSPENVRLPVEWTRVELPLRD